MRWILLLRDLDPSRPRFHRLRRRCIDTCFQASRAVDSHANSLRGSAARWTDASAAWPNRGTARRVAWQVPSVSFRFYLHSHAPFVASFAKTHVFARDASCSAAVSAVSGEQLVPRRADVLQRHGDGRHLRQPLDDVHDGIVAVHPFHVATNRTNRKTKRNEEESETSKNATHATAMAAKRDGDRDSLVPRPHGEGGRNASAAMADRTTRRRVSRFGEAVRRGGRCEGDNATRRRAWVDAARRTESGSRIVHVANHTTPGYGRKAHTHTRA